MVRLGKRKTKKQLAYEKRFSDAVERVLQDVGADRHVDLCDVAGAADASFWTVQTRCGLLTIRVMDGWIACRFVRPDLATQLMGQRKHLFGHQRLNSYSGKWNWMYGVGCPEGGEDALVSDFRYALFGLVTITATLDLFEALREFVETPAGKSKEARKLIARFEDWREMRKESEHGA